MRRTFAGTVAVCVALACPVGGQDAAQAARTWRQAHERQIVADYLDFLRLPNVAKDSGHHPAKRRRHHESDGRAGSQPSPVDGPRRAPRRLR